MMAVAADLDERETYMRYIFSGGDQKKWKWATPDRAGTRPGAKSDNAGLGEFIGKAIQSGSVSIAKGRAYDIARAQGRRVVFVDEHGKSWLEDGSPTERTMDDFPLPMTYKHQHEHIVN